jgi:hypothetical protein
MESAYGVSREQIEKGDGFLHEKARKARVEEGWRERLKLYQLLRSVETVQETFDVIERVSQVSEFAWIPLGAKTYYMNIGDGKFIECVEEHDGYFEVRAIEESELKFIGSGTDLKSAIQIADTWLSRHGVNYTLQHRSQPWRQKKPSDSQIVTARRLTGLPEKFLGTLSRGQLSDLIASATALLIPAAELKLPKRDNRIADRSETSPVAAGAAPLHVWQFGQN